MIVILLFGIGIIFIIAGVQGKANELGSILVDDFTGSSNYLAWIVAVLFVGFIASLKETRELGNAFYALLIVVLLLSQRGFFEKFKEQVLN